MAVRIVGTASSFLCARVSTPLKVHQQKIHSQRSRSNIVQNFLDSRHRKCPGLPQSKYHAEYETRNLYQTHTKRRSWVCKSGASEPPASSSSADLPTPPADVAGDVATSWQRPMTLWLILAVVLLHLLGFTILGPIIPSLAQHFSLASSQVGYLTSAYPLGMFFALFVWPPLSDLVGRRPVLLASLLGVGLGFVLQGVAISRGWPYWMFIALRVASGAMAGASAVIKAYIADIATSEEMPRFMAWREAAATSAFILGPAIGGYLYSQWSLAAIIALSGWASVVAAGLVVFMVDAPKPDAIEQERRKEEELKQQMEEENQTTNDGPFKSLVCPLGSRDLVSIVATICLTSFFYNLGQASFDAFFAVLATTRFSLQVKQVGLILTCLASVSFLVSSLVFHRMQSRLGITFTCVLGLTLIALGLGSMGIVPSINMLFVAALVYVVGIPLFTPTVPILLMQCVPYDRRGQIMGIDSAVNTVGRIIGPIIFGVIYGKHGPELSFVAAACMVLTAAIITISRRVYVLGRPPAEPFSLGGASFGNS